MRRTDHGIALLETLIAMVILSVAGLSVVGVARATLADHMASRAREQEVIRAERVLAAMSLLTARDLDIRLGIRDVGGFPVQVQRPEPDLYRIAVRAPANTGDVLVTVVHRPREDPQ